MTISNTAINRNKQYNFVSYTNIQLDYYKLCHFAFHLQHFVTSTQSGNDYLGRFVWLEDGWIDEDGWIKAYNATIGNGTCPRLLF